MNRLYKYYSSRFDLVKYLKDPTIKICQLHHLNDPFEGFITDAALQELIKKVHPILSPNTEETLSNINHSKLHIRRQIEALGITSLSETSRNLLMWSHYASEHKGICIGYKIPLIKPHKSSEIALPELRKVDYDSLLFDHEHIKFLQKKEVDIDMILSKTVDRILTTKSEGWSYEKEHRYITQIESSDIIRYTKNRQNNKVWIPKYIREAVNKAINENSHKVVENSVEIELTSKRTTEQLISAITDPYSVEMKMKKSNDVVFLKRIPIENIDSIYFGAKHSKITREEIEDLKISDERYSNLNLYQYELSNERYEIVPYALDELINSIVD